MTGLGRSIRQILIALFYYSGFIGIFGMIYRNISRKPCVLVYHSVSDSENDGRPICISKKMFKKHMFYLKKKFRIISMSDYLKGLSAGRGFFRNSILITIDDGYDDTYRNAFKILKSLELPFTLFLTVNNVTGQKGSLSWDKVRKMVAAGVIIGGHGIAHVDLTSLDEKRMLEEIKGAKQRIEDKTGKTIEAFAFPYSRETERERKALRDCGYFASFTSRPCVFPDNNDIYSISRTVIRDIPVYELAYLLSGIPDLIRGFKEKNAI